MRTGGRNNLGTSYCTGYQLAGYYRGVMVAGDHLDTKTTEMHIPDHSKILVFRIV